MFVLFDIQIKIYSGDWDTLQSPMTDGMSGT